MCNNKRQSFECATNSRYAQTHACPSVALFRSSVIGAEGGKAHLYISATAFEQCLLRGCAPATARRTLHTSRTSETWRASGARKGQQETEAQVGPHMLQSASRSIAAPSKVKHRARRILTGTTCCLAQPSVGLSLPPYEDMAHTHTRLTS